MICFVGSEDSTVCCTAMTQMSAVHGCMYGVKSVMRYGVFEIA